MGFDPYSSTYLEIARLQAQLPPNIDGMLPEDPAVYLARLDELESPNQRLWTFFKSLVSIREAPTHEAFQVQSMILTGSLFSGIFGGLLKNRDLHHDFVRQHNASVFENQYTGNRLFWDSLVMGVARKGLRYAVGGGLLIGSSGIVMFGSMTYRNRLHWPDWVGGFAAIGSLSRLWIGTRGVIAGGLLGAITGLGCFGVAKGIEVVSGVSVPQRRYEHHHQWLNTRERWLRTLQERHETHFRSKMDER